MSKLPFKIDPEAKLRGSKLTRPKVVTYQPTPIEQVLEAFARHPVFWTLALTWGAGIIASLLP